MHSRRYVWRFEIIVVDDGPLAARRIIDSAGRKWRLTLVKHWLGATVPPIVRGDVRQPALTYAIER